MFIGWDDPQGPFQPGVLWFYDPSTAFWHLKVGCGGGAFSLCSWGGVQGSHQHLKSSAGSMMLMVSFSYLQIHFSMFTDMFKALLFLHCSASKFTIMCFTCVGYWFFVPRVALSKLVLPSSQAFTPLMANNWPVNDDLFTGILYVNLCKCFWGLWDHPTPLNLYATFYSRVTHSSFYTEWMYLYTYLCVRTCICIPK